ncbi:MULTISPECIES: hypothetical protein [unclassified Microcoleus]|uniref:hypothetical protein n=1 Tax=unclassified Microcoleus TaxID=2642155 RepID=UPI002FD68C13
MLLKKIAKIVEEAGAAGYTVMEAGDRGQSQRAIVGTNHCFRQLFQFFNSSILQSYDC